MNLAPNFADRSDPFAQWTELTGDWTFYKNGKPKDYRSRDITWLRKCDHCGFLGTPRRVAYRSDCHVYDWPHAIDLCVACWNRFRVVVKTHYMLAECKYLINKVLRLSVNKRLLDGSPSRSLGR